MNKRLYVVSTLLLMALSALLLPGCGSARPATNLLLITLDTTRADRLGCYGYELAETPALDGLAKDGTLFEDIITSVPLTLPAHATLLTGLHAPEHNLPANASGMLSPTIPTLAEILRERGYATGAFIASPVLKAKFGLDRGFDVYDDPEPADSSQHEQFGMVLYGVGDHQRLNRYRYGDEMADVALSWLKEQQDDDDPFFCWVHFYDPHQPYNAHKDLFGEQFESPYDAEIAYMDSQIARLLSFIDSQGIAENTLIVVIGDHGQGLDDHGEETHGLMLYDTTMHVPLIISQTGHVPTGTRVTTTLPLADLFPTMLDMLGVADRPYRRGDPRNKLVSNLMKRSFAGAVQGEAIDSRLCYAETLHPHMAYGWSPLYSVTTPQWKFIRTAREELYDRQADPEELHNLLDELPDQADDMRTLLADLETRMTRTEAMTVSLSTDDIRQLESLGYMAGGQADRPIDLTALRDVKDMIHLARKQWKVTEAIKEGNFSDSILELCRELVAASPDSAVFHDELGTILMHRGDTEGAIASYEQALQVDPNYFHAINNLGIIKSRQQRFEEALPLIARAHELQPLEERTRYNLAIAHSQFGLALGRQDQLDRAEEHLRKAISLLPELAEAHYNLGVALLKQGRTEESITSLEEALRLQPDYPLAERTLGIARQRAQHQR